MIQQDFHLGQYSGLMLAGFLLMLGSGLLAWVLAHMLGINWRAFVPPAMFSNWANLGIPLYVLALGEQALGGGVMLVVAGNILCFTLGTYIFANRISVVEVITTPILLAVIAGVVVNLSGLPVPEVVDQPLGMLGQIAIPLMLFSLGVRLTRIAWADWPMGLIMALFCPIVGVSLAFLIMQFIDLSGLHQSILILFGALPPAVVNFMLAEQYNQEPEKVASMVLLGNMFAVVTLPAALMLLQV